MLRLGEKRPILFEILLVVLAFLAAAVFTAAGNVIDMHPDLSSSIGRIAVGILLIVLYHRAFRGENPLKNFIIVLPALLFAVWNLFYNLSSGAEFGGMSFYSEALVTAMAPAIFEEVLFRGIFIYNLKQSNCSDGKGLFITAIVFSAVHMTNLVGQDLASVALQLVYSFVIGMALAAIYLKNNSLIQVILVHFLIDFTNRIYINPATTTTTVQMIVFILLLIAETVYSLWLIFGKNKLSDKNIHSD